MFFPGHYARVESAGSGESYSTPRQLPAETFEVVKTNALDETELWPQIFSELVLSLIFSQLMSFFTFNTKLYNRITVLSLLTAAKVFCTVHSVKKALGEIKDTVPNVCDQNAIMSALAATST